MQNHEITTLKYKKKKHGHKQRISLRNEFPTTQWMLCNQWISTIEVVQSVYFVKSIKLARSIHQQLISNSSKNQTEQTHSSSVSHLMLKQEMQISTVEHASNFI